MREIKFRAWDKKMQEMYDVIEMGWRGRFGIRIGFLENSSWGSRPRELNEVEIMQYTGLKDKNGKEAYHKDRVSALGYSNWIIEWYRNGWKLFQEGSVCNYLDIPDDFVITGNIYEN